MGKVELRDGAYQVRRMDDQDNYAAYWAGVVDREREKFYISFHRNEGRLMVTMGMEMDRFHHDWSRWLEEVKKSPTMRLEMKEEEGQLVFERFAVDCQEEGKVVTGEMVRNYESGVADIRMEAKGPSGGKVTLWYEGEEEKGFAFWGIFAGMPLPEPRGMTQLPTVAIRPRIMPGKMVYWAPSVEGDVLFTDAWEREVASFKPQFFGIGLTHIYYIVRHRERAQEGITVRREGKEGVVRLETDRKVWGLPKELRDRPFFANTSMKTQFPLVFPRGLVEVEGDRVGEELAGELISKMLGLRAILEGVFVQK